MKLYMITLVLTVMVAFLELVAATNGYEIPDLVFYGSIGAGLVTTGLCFISRDLGLPGTVTRSEIDGEHGEYSGNGPRY